jgi:type II secretory pathway pseudopilin PulG
MNPMPLASQKKFSRGAFSLVEVVLALGIVSFAVLLILGLLPIGLQSTRDSLDETEALNVISQIVADREATPATESSKIYGLPPLTSEPSAPVTTVFGIADSNSMTSSSLSVSRYRVQSVLIIPSPGRLDPYVDHLTVTWPPNGGPGGQSVDAVVTFPQP